MNIIVLLLFISMILVMVSLVFFYFTVGNRDIHRGDQISLLPLEDEHYADKTNHL